MMKRKQAGPNCLFLVMNLNEREVLQKYSSQKKLFQRLDTAPF